MRRLTEAVLLLGGSGRRLGSLTLFTNKHLLPVHRRTLAENAALWLAGCRMSRIISVATPETRAVFDTLLRPLIDAGCSLEVVTQPSPIGTQDAVNRALALSVEDQVFVLFGDNVFERPLSETETSPLSPRMDARCYTSFVGRGLAEFGYVDSSGRTPLVISKPHARQRGDAVTGAFVIRKSALTEYEPDGRPAVEGEDDLMRFIIACGRREALEVIKLKMRWCDAGSSSDALLRAGRLAKTIRW